MKEVLDRISVEVKYFSGSSEIELDSQEQVTAENIICSFESWLPALRNPEELYTAYSGNLDELTKAARDAALSDLSRLSIVPGLSKEAFENYVGTMLLQQPVIRKIDVMVLEPQRFGAIRDFLASLPCNRNVGFDANRAWQTLIRWLRYFLPGRYGLSVPRHSEIFFRITD